MKPLLQLLLLAGVSGCQHAPPTVFVRDLPPSPVSGSNTLNLIRLPSRYKAYTVGRHADAVNHTLMHESHVVYVRESQDSWNLQPPGEAIAPGNLPAPAPDPAFAPLPLNEQLRLELQRQQQLSQSLAEQAQRVQQSTDAFVPAVRKAAEVGAQLQQRLHSLETRLNRLESESAGTANTNPSSPLTQGGTPFPPAPRP